MDSSRTQLRVRRRAQGHAEPTRQGLIRRDCLCTPLRIQQYHIRNTHIARIIPKRPAHRQRRPVVRELDHRRCGLRDRDAVVEVQGPGRFAVDAWRDDEVEIELAQRGGRVGAIGAERDDGAAFDVDGDLGKVRVNGDGGARAAEGLVGEEVVELVVGEVDGDAGGAFVCHGSDQDGGAVEVLKVQRQGVGIGGVEEEHGVQKWCAVNRLLIEGCVNVVEELVARFDCYLRGFRDAWPEVVFLMEDVGGVVVAIEGVECSQHSPACAQLFGRVTSIAANVRSDHRNLIDGCECDHFSD